MQEYVVLHFLVLCTTYHQHISTHHAAGCGFGVVGSLVGTIEKLTTAIQNSGVTLLVSNTQPFFRTVLPFCGRLNSNSK